MNRPDAVARLESLLARVTERKSAPRAPRTTTVVTTSPAVAEAPITRVIVEAPPLAREPLPALEPLAEPAPVIQAASEAASEAITDAPPPALDLASLDLMEPVASARQLPSTPAEPPPELDLGERESIPPMVSIEPPEFVDEPARETREGTIPVPSYAELDDELAFSAPVPVKVAPASVPAPAPVVEAGPLTVPAASLEPEVAVAPEVRVESAPREREVAARPEVIEARAVDAPAMPVRMIAAAPLTPKPLRDLLMRSLALRVRPRA